MGKFLTTNLNIYLQYNRKLADDKMSKSNAGFEVITNDFFGNPDFFDLDSSEEYYSWRLKPKLLSEHLHPLLTKYYPDIYGNDSYYSKEYEAMLKLLKTAENLQNYVENARYTTFSYRKSWDYYFDGPPRKAYYVEHIQLASEGKVISENIYGHLSLFSRLLRNNYADNPLATCLNVDIWG